jgi:hypothetical protein
LAVVISKTGTHALNSSCGRDYNTGNTLLYSPPEVGERVTPASSREASALRPSLFGERSKRIEDEWNGKLRALLAARLRTEVEARKWEVDGPSKPDGAWYFDRDEDKCLAVFSGKMGTRRQMTEAINTAGDYQENIGRAEPVEEAFGVTYPEKGESFGLYALRSMTHGFKSYPLDTIEEVADTICSILIRKEPVPEPSEAMMLRLLQACVEEVSAAFDPLSARKLVAHLGSESPLMSSVVVTVEPVEVSETTARTAAAYILVNQILFYHILSSHKELNLVKLDRDGFDPRALKPKYFAKVLDIDYKPIFEHDIAIHLRPDDGRRALRDLARAFEFVEASQIGNDVIGKIFHKLIPERKRKILGAFYTNSNAAELLARLAIDREFDRVIDPACGSGTILVGAYDAKKEKYEEGGRRLDAKTHEKFVGSQLTGIDIMVFSAHLAVVHLCLQAPDNRLERVQVAIKDSLQLRPGMMVETSRSVIERATRMGLRRIDAYGEDGTLIKHTTQEGGIQGEFRLNQVEVCLMNPPFSDSDRIPRTYKDGLEKRFGDGRARGLLRGKYSLQLPFLLLADEFLVEGGRLGAVLPVTTFTGEAFSGWVDFVVKNYTVRAVVIGTGRGAFSENTKITECLFVAEKTPPPEDHRFVLLAIQARQEAWTLPMIRRMAAAVHTLEEGVIEGFFSTRLVEQDQLLQSVSGLQSLIERVQPSSSALLDEVDRVLNPVTIPFRDLEASTGLRFLIDELANKEQDGPEGRGRAFYFVPALTYLTNRSHEQRKDDRLLITQDKGDTFVVEDLVTGDAFNVPKDRLVPFARRISSLPTIDATRDLDWIARGSFHTLGEIIGHLMATTPGLSGAPEKKGIYLHRVRERWPDRVERGKARAWMSNKVNLSAPETRLLAAYSNSSPMIGRAMWRVIVPEPNQWIEKALVLWFNSTFFLAQLLSFRTETQGTYGRIDKHKLLDSRIPDFSRFTRDQSKQVVDLFEEVKSIEFPSIMDQLRDGHTGRKNIDLFFMVVLGTQPNPNQREAFLGKLYAGIRARLVESRGGMRARVMKK